jgi:hypothetical protein
LVSGDELLLANLEMTVPEAADAGPGQVGD